MSNFKIEKLNSVIVPVKDLERSIHFYKHILQLKIGYSDSSMAYFSFGMDENQTTILLHVMDEVEPTEKGMVMELWVDDIKAAISSFKGAGVEVAQEPINRDWGVSEAVIVDPDGYKIWMSQPLK